MRDDFRANLTLSGAEQVEAIRKGQESLELLRRQQIIGNLYPTSGSVMEAPAAEGFEFEAANFSANAGTIEADMSQLER